MSKLYTKIEQNLISRFCNFRKTVAKNLSLIVVASIDCNSFSTHKIATSVAKITDTAFHNGENRVANFLKTDTFEVGDKAFRNMINLVFDLLRKRGFLEGLKYIPINVDFTSERNNFLILSASIPFFGRALPIFFSIRNYPKTKNQFSQKKMEAAFFLRLRHLLPKKFEYIIVMDRGFGNLRILDLMDRFNFNYVVRFKENTKIKIGTEIIQLSKIPKIEKKYTNISLKTDKNEKLRNLTISFSKDKKLKQGWYLISNLNFENLQNIYKNRFQIEKTFQDQKSSGFNIEKTKIKSYSKFKKLLYCVYLAQDLLLFLGEYISQNVDHIKKKSPEILLNT
jgi:hypothetical protein